MLELGQQDTEKGLEEWNKTPKTRAQKKYHFISFDHPIRCGQAPIGWQWSQWESDRLQSNRSDGRTAWLFDVFLSCVDLHALPKLD